MTKVTRAAFLYFDPTGDGSRFAQCATCMMWTGAGGPHPKRCSIHGPALEVTSNDTCGLYVHGTPMPNAHVAAAVTTKESGFEERAVRCENCRFYKSPRRCGLYAALNTMLPDSFELNERVHPQGCCNANMPKGYDT